MKHPIIFVSLLLLNVLFALSSQAKALSAGEPLPNDDCGACYHGFYDGEAAHSSENWVGGEFVDVINNMNWTHGRLPNGCWNHNHTACCIPNEEN